VELAGGTARNSFIDCTLPFQCSAATPIGLTVAGASGMDRYALFKNCSFINNVGSTSTTMSAFGTLAASAGGQVVVQNTMMVGITEFGSDATTRGQIFIDMPTPTAADGGIGVNPT
jgi:hypothetical protein